MKNKIWIHILLWGAMILYLFIAPAIKDKLAIVSGDPVSLDGVSLVSSELIKYGVDRMISFRLDGQTLYQLRGWSFIDNGSDQSLYELFIVLSSDRSTYYFPTIPESRTDLIKTFPDVGLDLSNSGFECRIAKEKIKNGSYTIGLLYRVKATGQTYYRLTNMFMIKTYNNLHLQDR